MKIGNYFTLEELTRTSKPMENTPCEAEITNLQKLTRHILDPLREAYGKPIIVNSGFRSQQVNAAVGGSATSQHRTGQAADIRTAENTKEKNRQLYELIKQLQLPFDQLINEYDFSWVHVSYDEKRNRRQELKIP